MTHTYRFTPGSVPIDKLSFWSFSQFGSIRKCLTWVRSPLGPCQIILISVPFLFGHFSFNEKESDKYLRIFTTDHLQNRFVIDDWSSKIWGISDLIQTVSRVSSHHLRNIEFER